MTVRTTLKLPSVGESINTVTVIQWFVTTGGRINIDQVVASVETDKVDIDIPTPIAGIVVEILAPPGTEIAVGDPMCVIVAQ